VMNFIPDQSKAISEMKRASRPNGIVGAYVWDYASAYTLQSAYKN